MLKSLSKDSFVGFGVLALAAVVLLATFDIPPPPPYSRVGPAFIGYICGAGLAVLGVFLLVAARAGGWSHESEEEHVRPDFLALAWVGLGLLFNVTLIASLGFVISSTLMFICVARGFGSHRPGRDLLVAVLLTLTAYYGFAKLLRVNIGGGILEGLL